MGSKEWGRGREGEEGKELHSESPDVMYKSPHHPLAPSPLNLFLMTERNLVLVVITNLAVVYRTQGIGFRDATQFDSAVNHPVVTTLHATLYFAFYVS